MVVAAALALTVSMQEPAAGPTVGVLPVQADAGLAEPDRERLDEHFTAGLSRSGFSTRPVEGKAGSSCSDPDCFQELSSSSGVGQLAGATVTKTGPDYQVRAFVIDGASGETVVEAEGLCEICGIAELDDMVEGLAARLRNKLATAVTPARLVVDSKPSGSEVEIDGTPAGTTPVDIPVTPGEHQIAIKRDGYRQFRTTETVEAGATGTYQYRLKRERQIPAWAPWTALGVGGGALVTGIVLLAIDGNEIKRDCNADIDGRCEYLHDTLAGGVVMTVSGVALIGTGIALAIIRKKRGGSNRRLEASAWLHSPGLTISGRF